jgi:hypothetical protein
MAVTSTLLYQHSTPSIYGDTEERLYILTDSKSNIIRYALLIFGPPNECNHMTAYLNLPKSEWLQVDDRLRGPMNVTFEGVESQRVSVKNKVDKIVPVALHNFWIGIDWMGNPGLKDWDGTLHGIATLCLRVNQELIKAEIKRAKDGK